MESVSDFDFESELDPDFECLSNSSSMTDNTFNFLNYKFKINKLYLKIEFLEQELKQMDIFKKELFFYKNMLYNTVLIGGFLILINLKNQF